MLDLASLWDFDDPEGSLARFTSAAGRADEPEHALLLTQAARAHGLAGRFTSGRRILDSLDVMDAEVLVRTALEHGRLDRSEALACDDGSRATALVQRAGQYFQQAAALASDSLPSAGEQAEVLAGLQLDALHTLALLPNDPSEQATATRAALAVAEASLYASARRWRAPLLNNLGMALHDAGDDEGALEVFERGRALREELGDRRGEQVARWTIGWVLRHLGRRDEALAVQEQLARDLAADGVDDRYVTEELALLHQGPDTTGTRVE